MIAVIDYGMGNIGSIINMLKKIGTESMATSDESEISRAEKIILPGVGSFDKGMQNVMDRSLVPVLKKKAFEEKVPILGICLGMQLLTRSSEEGRLQGLGMIDADTIRFQPVDSEPGLKIPHMGWNHVVICKPCPLTRNLGDEPRYYFVHSYHVVCDDPSDTILQTVYGIPFTSAFQKENISGVQFHPEKSHTFGIRLLSNFVHEI